MIIAYNFHKQFDSIRCHVLGDSAFPLTETMITPYTKAETSHDMDKALFNIRHSGARVEMTEDTFGIWKKRFPILTEMRLDLQNSMDVVEVTAILHNLGLMWGDLVPPELFPEAPPAVPDFIEDEVIFIDDSQLSRASRRQKGVLARDALLRRTMNYPPTESEKNRIRRLQSRR